MAYKIRESRLARECIDWVRKRGGIVHKVHGSPTQRAGEPDLDGAIEFEDGIVHFKIELKVGTHQPTPLQKHRIEEYKRMGYASGVAYSLNDFISIVILGPRLKRHYQTHAHADQLPT